MYRDLAVRLRVPVSDPVSEKRHKAMQRRLRSLKVPGSFNDPPLRSRPDTTMHATLVRMARACSPGAWIPGTGCSEAKHPPPLGRCAWPRGRSPGQTLLPRRPPTEQRRAHALVGDLGVGRGTEARHRVLVRLSYLVLIRVFIVLSMLFTPKNMQTAFCTRLNGFARKHGQLLTALKNTLFWPVKASEHFLV